MNFDNLISGVKNFLPARKELIVTRVVEALMEPSIASAQALQDTDDYLLFDPRQGRTSTAKAGGKNRLAFSDAIVFVVGGGGYVEYSNLQEYAAKGAMGGGAGATGGYSAAAVGSGRKRITYGSTEILTPSAFVGVLDTLSKT